MDEVRTEIDRVDQGLVDLLAERWTYVDRMWELKRAEAAQANVPWRNRAVIDRVRARAAEKASRPKWPRRFGARSSAGASSIKMSGCATADRC